MHNSIHLDLHTWWCVVFHRDVFENISFKLCTLRSSGRDDDTKRQRRDFQKREPRACRNVQRKLPRPGGENVNSSNAHHWNREEIFVTYLAQKVCYASTSCLQKHWNHVLSLTMMYSGFLWGACVRSAAVARLSLTYYQFQCDVSELHLIYGDVVYPCPILYCVQLLCNSQLL